VKDYSQQLVSINQSIDQKFARIKELEATLTSAMKTLEKTKKDLAESEERLEDSNQQLRMRVKGMYQSGPVSYLEVLLNSGSFSDFTNRLEFLTRMVESDKTIVDRISKEKQQIDLIKQEYTMIDGN